MVLVGKKKSGGRVSVGQEWRGERGTGRVEKEWRGGGGDRVGREWIGAGGTVLVGQE